MIKKVTILILLAVSFISWAQKTVYIPRFITNVNMDLNNPASQWCYARSIQNDDIVVFWEAGFGANPSTATGSNTVNITTLMSVAQKSYNNYLDTLKFAIRGASVTDKHKLMIFLLYQTEWAAYGSGQDDLVGTLHVNPPAARANTVLAHEIGHCFQYIAGCDNRQGGWRYGFGVNGAGGNGFWEQCANWMAFKTYPAQQFTAGDFNNYIRNNHLHIIHESPRYANYFVQDYWTFKHGKDFLGRLWRLSRRPEDPIEAYKRLTAINQEKFNDEMYEHASRLTTWDLPAIRSFGANYIDNRPQPRMNLTSDNYWMIDPSVCIENYGYNSIKLNVPTRETVVTVKFRGRAGQSGFRSLNVTKGGWRYGFVALLRDGTRVYSTVGAPKVVDGATPEESLSFTCPANCSRLWLVVSGAPQEHWKHAWDDDNTNDEHWPYQVQFVNTNLTGNTNIITSLETSTASDLIGVFPNPTKSNFNLNNSKSIDFQVIDMYGKVCEEYKNVSNIEFGQNLKPGIYFLKSEDNIYKIIKE